MVIKRKAKKLTQDVESVNRWGCGCVTAIIFGIVLAMIVAGLLQTQK